MKIRAPLGSVVLENCMERSGIRFLRPDPLPKTQRREKKPQRPQRTQRRERNDGKMEFQAVGAALRRDLGEQPQSNRGINPLLQFSKSPSQKNHLAITPMALFTFRNGRAIASPRCRNLRLRHPARQGCRRPTVCVSKLQSPASRSARWVTDPPYNRTPTGFHKTCRAVIHEAGRSKAR